MSSGNEGTRTARVEVSVVIPVFNEEGNLEPLLAEIEDAMATTGRTYEVICVDDQSTDGSLALLRRLQQEKATLRVVRHRVNCGESAGEATGFEHARGDVIITIDGDRQNDPADIPLLLDAMEDDVAAVCGVRRKREDDAVKRLSSRIANGFRNRITGDRIADAGCTYRALRRAALHDVLVFNGMHRFLPTILRLQGYKVREILVNHRPRTRGESKYGVGNRMWRGIVDCFAMRWYRRRCLPGSRALPEEEPATGTRQT
jgi:glycosyltransferase involved in cell wall biosynthesis